MAFVAEGSKMASNGPSAKEAEDSVMCARGSAEAQTNWIAVTQHHAIFFPTRNLCSNVFVCIVQAPPVTTHTPGSLENWQRPQYRVRRTSSFAGLPPQRLHQV